MTETTIPEAELLALATRALARSGMPEAEAGEAARVLVLADMFGLRTHGISRVAQYLERVKLGGINPRAAVQVMRMAPGLSMIDGQNGVGTLVGMRALRAATESAREVGIGAAFARGSNHFGPVLPYAFLAAQEGFASFIASNATTTIAPWGGKDTRVGNNPMGIGMPNPGGDPIILDMALSVAARAKIRKLAEQGAAMPEGWATDAEGKPTTDPARALKGFLLPVGGHKGYGLAVMIDLLAGLLSGAAYLTHVQAWDKNPGVAQNLGHVFILIDTSRLQAREWLQERMADFGEILRGTPPADPAAPVMAPGDREMAVYARSRREGVAVASADLRAVEALARG
ncbi:MAG TPA: Ldh family oxidoreductase [Roseomonas sp.]|nr:Ldh family oxidoreductase [Roseomonas sp.]